MTRLRLIDGNHLIVREDPAEVRTKVLGVWGGIVELTLSQSGKTVYVATEKIVAFYEQGTGAHAVYA
jgi:hypothetical protein